MDNNNNPNQFDPNLNNPNQNVQNQYSADRYYNEFPNVKEYQEQMSNQAQFQPEYTQGYNQQNYMPDQNGYQQNYMPEQNNYQQGYMPEQNIPQQGYQPQQNDPSYISPEDNHKANILCVISLCCMFGGPLLSSIVTGFFYGTTSSETIGSQLSSFFYSISGIAHIAAWILMIYVRVKYKRNTMGKVLMITYIILLVLAILGIIILVASCLACAKDLRDCGC